MFDFIRKRLNKTIKDASDSIPEEEIESQEQEDISELVDLEVAYPTGPTIDVSDEERIIIYVDEEYIDNLWIRTNSGEDIRLSEYYYNGKVEFNTLTDETYTFSYMVTGSGSIDIQYQFAHYHKTGEWLNGNVDTKDGGSFTVDYKVLDDNVLSAYQINSDYYRPTGIKGIVPCWKNENNEWEMEDKEVVYGTSSGALDLTGNAILKMIIYRNATTESQYPSIFSDIYDEINFPSVRFEATIPNNLKFALGDVIALSGGVGPTRFSFIENINTDISGPTILSNNRGGEK